MSFTIHKHIGPAHSHGLWTVEKRNGVCGPLYWVEMLAIVAKELLEAKYPPYPFEQKDGPRLGPVYSLIVERGGDNHYTVRCGAKFQDGLCSDEALGCIASYTLTDGERQLFGGMKSYEQWVGQYEWRRQEIVGLLTHQPELVA